jgi:predicted peptidase
MPNISYTYVPDPGWTGRGFEISHTPVEPSRLRLTVEPKGKTPYEVPILSAEAADGVLRIGTGDFNYREAWTLRVGEDAYTRRDMDIERCEGLERFEAKRDGGVIYRLYTPKAAGPRPMILFLHGGGNGGDDLITHIAADYGCIQFADRYPDFFVMAPQAPDRDMKAFLASFPKMDFAHSDETGPYGWYREYLAEICVLIRRMIAAGQVDGRRVYVTGMSMGGAGTIRAMSVGAGLFAACVPVCPSMTPETFGILKGMVHQKVWVATSYVDHKLYRHKYIVDAILSLRDAGNRDAHLTLYAPEELEKYGIATDPDLTLQERIWANHWSWVPTYHDEHGIMSWLTSQTL